MKANQAAHSVGVIKIEATHRCSRGAYGSPMIHAELADDHGIRGSIGNRPALIRAALCVGAAGRGTRQQMFSRKPMVAKLRLYRWAP